MGYMRLYFSVALCAVAVTSQAQVSPNGPDFQVNTYTIGQQEDAEMAAGAEGNFIVVWQSLGSSGSDTDHWSVHARRYAASGTPLGGQFQVNTYTTDGQQWPAVASDAQGNFIVVWTSYGSSESDEDLSSIQARRYAANGTPLGEQFQVNTYTTSSQLLPAVAADAQANFIVAWYSFGSSGSDTSATSIHARRYDANGTPLGGQFQVNTYTTFFQDDPALASDPQGNFVVAWESIGSFGSDTDGSSIQVQRYDANGTPSGGEFQVNTFTTFYQSGPAVAASAEGNFIVAWTNYVAWSSGLSSVHARRYAANGTPSGGQFQVNTYTTGYTGYQKDAAVTGDAQGNFIVAWGGGSTGPDTGASIQARRYAATGTPMGGQFQVNSSTTSYQSDAAVAADAEGNFILAWHGGNPDLNGVQARRFDALFRDGFEVGNTSRWSVTGP